MSALKNSITGLRNNQNRYFIFKNADRRKNMRITNFFMTSLFVLCYLAFATAFVWIVILFIGGVFGLFLQEGYTKIFVNPGIVLLASAGTFIVFYIAKYFIEGFYIEKEIKDLSIDADLNRKHLTIAKAVKKVRNLSLICAIIVVVAVAAGAACAILNVPIVAVVALALIAILYVVYRIVKFKIYTTIHNEVTEVIAERRALRATTR